MSKLYNSIIDYINSTNGVTKAAIGLVCATGVGYVVYRVGVSTRKEEPKELVSSACESATALKNLGNAMFQEKRYCEAVTFYEKALQLLPPGEDDSLTAILFQNKGAANDALGNDLLAFEDLSKAIDLNLRYLKARIRRAKLCERLQRYLIAAQDWVVVGLIEEFKKPSTIECIDRLLRKAGAAEAQETFQNTPPAVPGNRVFRNCFQAYCRDPIMNGLDHVETDNSALVLNEVSRLIKADKYRDLLPICDEYFSQDEKILIGNREVWQKMLLLRGTLHMCINEYQKAKTYFNKLISQLDKPTLSAFERDCLVAAHVRRAYLHLQDHEMDPFNEDFHAALALDPNNPDIFHQRGQFHLLFNQLDSANEDFREALRLDGGRSIVLAAHLTFTSFRIGAMAGLHDEVQQCLQNLTDLCDANHSSTEPETYLALACMEIRDFERAERYLQRAQEKDPTDGSVLVHRAMANLHSLGSIEQTVSLLEKAIQVDPLFELSYETLGTIEIQRGDLVRAARLFDQASKLAHSISEMSHILALKIATEIQVQIGRELNLPNLEPFLALRKAWSQV